MQTKIGDGQKSKVYNSFLNFHFPIQQDCVLPIVGVSRLFF